MTDPARPLAGLSVVVVEDDPRLREMVTIELEYAGARVRSCVNGLQALESLQVGVPDVLVMDLNLPGAAVSPSAGRSGASTSRPPARCRPSLFPAPSGNSELSRSKAGFTEYLSKPVSLERLVRTVGRLVGTSDLRWPTTTSPPSWCASPVRPST